MHLSPKLVGGSLAYPFGLPFPPASLSCCRLKAYSLWPTYRCNHGRKTGRSEAVRLTWLLLQIPSGNLLISWSQILARQLPASSLLQVSSLATQGYLTLCTRSTLHGRTNKALKKMHNTDLGSHTLSGICQLPLPGQLRSFFPLRCSASLFLQINYLFVHWNCFSTEQPD